MSTGDGGSPTPRGERFRVDAGEDYLAGEGDSVTLRAAGVNSTGPFVYRWSVERTPDDASEVTLSNATAAETTTSPLTTQGRYVFRVVVIDAGGRDAYAFITVNVGSPGTGTTTELKVSITGPASIAPDEAGELRAMVETEGAFTYLWEVVTDQAVTFESPDQPETGFTIAESGTVVVRVTVRDEAAHAVGAAEWTIEAVSEGGLTVTASGPSSVAVDEMVAVSASVSNAEGEVTYSWTVTDGEAELTDADKQTVSVRPTAVGRLAVQVEVTDTAGNTADAEYMVTITEELPQVLVTIVDFGEMVFELRPDVAPETVANFLQYVDDGFYDGLLIHRVVADFVVQGGGFQADENGELVEVETRDPIPSEADNGLSNVRGTVAMALSSSGGQTLVDSATSQWFVNLANNNLPGPLDLDAQGFTVFGTVIEGMDVADAIGQVAVTTRSSQVNAPVEDVVIESIVRREVPSDGGGS
ncbi:MAG: peptidylprolyl isomerase [Planctomycetota bacterium]